MGRASAKIKTRKTRKFSIRESLVLRKLRSIRYLCVCLIPLSLVSFNGILIGYSLGGTLACAVLKNMLESNPLQQQLLEENVACITFGQPPLVEADLETLLTQHKFLSKCFHYVHLDDCVKPILLKYCLVDLNTLKAKSEGSLSVAVSHCSDTSSAYFAIHHHSKCIQSCCHT